jgi:hypothetical protein
MTYGRDVYCFDHMVTGRLATGAELVAQALYRRLTTPRGTLRDGDEGLVYGIDMLGFVGTVGTVAAIDALPDVIRAEAQKDDRLDTINVKIFSEKASDGLVTLFVDIDATLADEDSDFRLSISVSDVTIALLGVTAQ